MLLFYVPNKASIGWPEDLTLIMFYYAAKKFHSLFEGEGYKYISLIFSPSDTYLSRIRLTLVSLDHQEVELLSPS